jgi:hypothetical protein
MKYLYARLFLGMLFSSGFLAPLSSAAILNGSFENFYNGWTTVGPNSVVPNIAGVLPTEGDGMAYLSSGTGAVPLSVHGFIIDSDLGFAPGFFEATVQAAYPNATEGATLFQSFTLDPSRNELRFDLNFLTNESASAQPNNDFAFYWVVDSSSNLVAFSALDVLNSSFTPTPVGSPYADQTGWLSYSVTGLIPGATYKLVFGVFDSVTTSGSSSLLVDNIRTVPEPSSALLVALVSSSLVLLRRRHLS